MYLGHFFYMKYIIQYICRMAVYKWAENQVLKESDVNDEDFNLFESIKAVLNTILPNIKFAKMSSKFLMDLFVFEKGFILSYIELKEFFNLLQKWNHTETMKMDDDIEMVESIFEDEDSDAEKEQYYLKTVYELAEKQCLKKQEMNPEDESFNIAGSIRSDLVQVIPCLKFYKMDKTFLDDFVVANGILSEEQASHVYDTQIKISNNGKSIYGSFKDCLGIRDAIEKHKCSMKRRSIKKIRFFKLKFAVPKTQSTVMKMVGAEWYLCLDEGGVLSFKFYTAVQSTDYLLTEMKSKNGFNLTADKETHIEAYYNNVPDL